jgi:hypothetical protein
MRILIVLCFIIFNVFGVFAQSNCSDTLSPCDSTILYIEVDELPKFQSGNFNTALEYIYSNIKYPNEADITGTVIVSFVVTKCGKIEKIMVEKELYKECDEEIKRVLLSMPKWQAGKKNNKYVNTLLFLPIKFKIQ